MIGGIETTHRNAELALAALKKIGLAASPRNFEVWYAHVEGRHPALSRDIQVATDSFGKVSQTNADMLFARHIQQADYAANVIDLATRFQSEVNDLQDVLEQSGETATGNSETLNDLADQIRRTSEEFPAVGALIEQAVSVAKDMRSQNEQLENRLAESTTQVTTLQRSVENIQAEAMKDPLTGVANRLMFDKSLEDEIFAAEKNQGTLALIMADIDHFKIFNDKWGHQTGDQVLRLVAEVMNANVKGQDILARYGGEEFAILLPGTSLENAHMLADRIRGAVEARRLKKRRSNEDLGVITMSMGVSEFRVSDTSESLVERADKCLYRAKDSGRNCVVNEIEFRTAAKKAAG